MASPFLSSFPFSSLMDRAALGCRRWTSLYRRWHSFSRLSPLHKLHRLLIPLRRHPVSGLSHSLLTGYSTLNITSINLFFHLNHSWCEHLGLHNWYLPSGCGLHLRYWSLLTTRSRHSPSVTALRTPTPTQVHLHCGCEHSLKSETYSPFFSYTNSRFHIALFSN